MKKTALIALIALIGLFLIADITYAEEKKGKGKDAEKHGRFRRNQGQGRMRGGRDQNPEQMKEMHERIKAYAEEHGISVKEAAKKLKEETKARVEALIAEYAGKHGITPEQARREIMMVIMAGHRAQMQEQRGEGEGREGMRERMEEKIKAYAEKHGITVEEAKEKFKKMMQNRRHNNGQGRGRGRDKGKEGRGHGRGGRGKGPHGGDDADKL